MVDAAYDLHRLSEDERIRVIGRSALSCVVGVCVEAGAKADRYVERVRGLFPGVELRSRLIFDKAGTIEMLEFGPKSA